MGIFRFVENIPKDSIINQQEDVVLREKMISLQERKLIVTILV